MYVSADFAYDVTRERLVGDGTCPKRHLYTRLDFLLNENPSQTLDVLYPASPAEASPFHRANCSIKNRDVYINGRYHPFDHARDAYTSYTRGMADDRNGRTHARHARDTDARPTFQDTYCSMGWYALLSVWAHQNYA